MTGVAFVVTSILALVPVEPGVSGGACGGSVPVIVTHSGHVSRTLRGDWETPDLVVLTFTSAWPDALAAILDGIERSVRLVLLLPSDEREEDAIRWLQNHEIAPESVDLIDLAVDTGWVRDYGPLQTTDNANRIIWLDADYSSRPSDDVVPRKLAQRFDVPFELVPEGVEGGAIVSNGLGLCVSTIEAFDQNAITTNDRDATDALLDQLGCPVLALLPALAHEKTKHADMFVQFMGPNTAAVASFNPLTAAEDAARMDTAAQMLEQAAATMGSPLKIVRIPHPAPDDEIYYSYLNGLRVRDDFLIPQYDSVDSSEENRAYQAFAEQLPELNLIPIGSDDIIELNGAVHCVTLGLDLPHTRLAAATRGILAPQFGSMGKHPQRGIRMQ